MRLNVSHATDAWMFGREQIRQWQAEFEAMWNEPEALLALDIWKKIPDPIKDLMRPALDPSLLDYLDGGEDDNKLAPTSVVKE